MRPPFSCMRVPVMDMGEVTSLFRLLSLCAEFPLIAVV